ncbi:MAG: hypothetical protein EBT94_10625 [Alphaproteobacteria bacterium]|nr:hypothetical protein [Alphaproteobacteria bacterium]
MHACRFSGLAPDRDRRAEWCRGRVNGAVVALGAAHGVATPRTQTLLALVHAREAEYSEQ